MGILACYYFSADDRLKQGDTPYTEIREDIDLDLIDVLLAHEAVCKTVNQTDHLIDHGKTALYRAIFGFGTFPTLNREVNPDCLPVVQRLLGAGACRDTGDTRDHV